ncbi:hypothetical protein KP509_20G029600 [Ceratopteris richardii]|uniref:Uncharacterized protein n=1 Tax=Ceratopteris richardii TaxID=49495 RepID=A0A8T2SE43_CERRI|nr:hypothetical protein KP509_20G029600 [Ceratopteris richardii]
MDVLQSHFTLTHTEHVPSSPPKKKSIDIVEEFARAQEEAQKQAHKEPQEPHVNKYEGRTHNLVKLIRMTGSGDLFAIPHPHKPSGYKCRNAYGFRPVFQDETTNSYFQNAVFKNTPEVLREKKLLPYHPNAPCNRSPQTYKNFVGTRCNDCRNASYLSLYDGVPKHLATPKTTNQLFMHYKQDPVGNANPAIFSDKAKRMHRLQCDG